MVAKLYENRSGSLPSRAIYDPSILLFQVSWDSHLGIVCKVSSLGTEKPMTAREVAEFYAFCSARRWGNFLHDFGPFSYYLTEKTWRKRKNPQENMQKIRYSPKLFSACCRLTSVQPQLCRESRKLVCKTQFKDSQYLEDGKGWGHKRGIWKCPKNPWKYPDFWIKQFSGIFMVPLPRKMHEKCLKNAWKMPEKPLIQKSGCFQIPPFMPPPILWSMIFSTRAF